MFTEIYSSLGTVGYHAYPSSKPLTICTRRGSLRVAFVHLIAPLLLAANPTLESFLVLDRRPFIPDID